MKYTLIKKREIDDRELNSTSTWNFQLLINHGQEQTEPNPDQINQSKEAKQPTKIPDWHYIASWLTDNLYL